MRTRVLFIVVCGYLSACGSDQKNPAVAQATGGAGGSGGETAGSAGSGPTQCGLPAAGAEGVAPPSGSPANLTVLPWAGFKAAVSYTFDDANSSQIAHYGELQALGVHMTFYLESSKGDASNAIWAQAVTDGHELGNHTAHHCHDTGCGADTDIGVDTDDCSAFITSKFGVTPWTMAAPYGDAGYVTVAQTRFLINRGVAGGSIGANDTSNPFNLPCYIPAQGALATAFNGVIDSAHTGGRWQIVLVHGFTGGTDGAYQPVDITEFTAGVAHAQSFGDVWIDSVVDVGAYWLAQKMLSSVAPTTSGNDQTWTWALPEHFPPGKCLRVKVDGGTLKQGGNALAWDSRGYYEIALDAGSLTLSP
jgi:peptidoglycan/xylan/chitin deacetylase (PgdA/CDA1 family)